MHEASAGQETRNRSKKSGAEESFGTEKACVKETLVSIEHIRVRSRALSLEQVALRRLIVVMVVVAGSDALLYGTRVFCVAPKKRATDGRL